MAHEDEKKLSEEQLANLWDMDEEEEQDTPPSSDEPPASEEGDALASLVNQDTSQEAGEVKATTQESSVAKGEAGEEEIDFTSPPEPDAWTEIDEAKKLREEAKKQQAKEEEQRANTAPTDYEDYVGELEQEMADEVKEESLMPSPEPTPPKRPEPRRTSKVLPTPISRAWDEDYTTDNLEEEVDEVVEEGYEDYTFPTDEDTEGDVDEVDLTPPPTRSKKLFIALGLGLALLIGGLAVLLPQGIDEPAPLILPVDEEVMKTDEEIVPAPVEQLPSEPALKEGEAIDALEQNASPSDEELAVDEVVEDQAPTPTDEPKVEEGKEKPTPSQSTGRRQEVPASTPTTPTPSKPTKEEKAWQEEANKALDELEDLLDF